MTRTPTLLSNEQLQSFTGDPRQLASVRRITLDDDVERGIRALSFSTGGGFDFWVLSDRSLDIGPLWWRGMPVAWQHPNGYVAPSLYERHADQATGMERALSGFLVTCGAEHVRQPTDGYALHGDMPLTPARLSSYGANWHATEPYLYCEGELTVSHLARPSYRLTRRIEAPVGQTSLRISDRIENIGLQDLDLLILYHINFGFPAITDGAFVEIGGDRKLEISSPQTGSVDSEVCFDCHHIGDLKGTITKLKRPASGQWPAFQASIATNPAQLPFVQLWSDPRPRRNIVAIEPVNCARNADGTSQSGKTISPGSTWSNQVQIEFSEPD